MIIKYDNAQIKKMCNNYVLVKRKYGELVADKLIMALEYINASDTLLDIKNNPIFKLHDLKGNRKGQYAIDLGRKLGFRLILIPLNEKEEQWDNRNINEIYKSTTIVMLLEVTNHYE